MPRIIANGAMEPVLGAFNEFLEQPEKTFQAGELIQFGWAWFRLDELDSELIVTTPELGSVSWRFVDDCSDSLNIVLRQRYICDSFGVDIQQCHARHSAIVPLDLGGCNEIFINRTDEADANASGWFIGAVDSSADPENPEHFELKSLWEISCIYPFITEYLCLPVNWQVFFDDAAIVLNDFAEVDCLPNSYFAQKKSIKSR